MKKIVLFGTGSISKFLAMHIKEEVEIVAYLADNEHGILNGVPVVAFNDLKNIEFDFIVVAFGNSIKGIEILKDKGIPDEKIVGYAYTGLLYKDNCIQQTLNEIKHNLIRDEQIPYLFDLTTREIYLCDTNVIKNEAIISRDFVREQTLSNLATEIYRNKVEGCVAEIGVSKGIFAQKINYLFPDRSLYLFDTYAGLLEKDIEYAMSLGWGEKAYAMSPEMVSVEEVLEIMPYKNKCIIKQGYFPDSFDLEESIAFASFDIDFYESTKRGLEVIYPHLSVGGYIMVHDFNNIAFEECKRAVHEFCIENNVTYVPIPDISGSVVITK